MIVRILPMLSFNFCKGRKLSSRLFQIQPSHFKYLIPIHSFKNHQTLGYNLSRLRLICKNIINPFNDVPRPSETKELTEALRRLSANLARGQAEIDREGREKRKQRVTVNSISPNGLLEYKSDGDTIYTSPSGKNTLQNLVKEQTPTYYYCT